MVVVCKEKCKSCKWGGSLSDNGYDTGACLYAYKNKKSRLYTNGVKMYDARYCDKYEAKRGRRCKAE